MSKSGLFFKYMVFSATILFAAVCVFAEPGIAQKRAHTVFFENSDHELHVYRISGKDSGETLLLIGGIQGDEPGGFLSAGA